MPPPIATRRGPAERAFWLVIPLLAAVTFVASLGSLSRPHFEGDEVVFTFLAERLRAEPLHYSIQRPLSGESASRFIREAWQPMMQFNAEMMRRDTSLMRREPQRVDQIRDYADWLATLSTAEVLYNPPRRSADGSPDDPRRPAYDPEVYDRPFFFHPPVVPYLLAAFRSAFGSAGGPLVSLLAQAATIILVGLIGRRLGGAACGIIAAVLMAADPITWLCANRVWLDGPLQATLCAAVLCTLIAAERGGWLRFAVAGACFGFAVLSKFPALLAAPALLVALFIGRRRPTPAELIVGTAAAAALVVPWLAITKANYGQFLPAAYPTQWLVSHYPYVQMLVNRPWYFYFFALALVAPIYLFVLFAATRRERQRRLIWVPLTWALCVICALLVMGAQKWGYQLRYLAPAMPAVCLATACVLRRLPVWTWLVLAPLTAVGVVSGIMSVEPPPVAEARPYLVEAALERQLPVRGEGEILHRTWPGMW